MFRLPIEQLNQLFAAIAETQTLYLPVDRNPGEAEYREWTQGAELSRSLNTVRSAKDFFFPQTENLVDFKTKNKTIEIMDTRSETEDFVVFGVRACDCKSFEILDSVFLAEPVDTFYQNRRQHATMITVACNRPETSCFCNAVGVDATNPGGDISTWMTKEALFLEAVTARGERLLAALGDLLTESDNTEVVKQQETTKELMKKLPFGEIDFTQFHGEDFLPVFESKDWAALSESCLGCGTCTFVCPTCQCYDIRDFDTGHSIKRFRCWDSCMYSDFTKMAHGNPRLTQLERFRQRFMHKLVYHPNNHDGQLGCVGCGRCVTKCPISMNIVKVAKKLGEK